MTKGPGRSDCCRVGVTYGYRECLRWGPGQGKSCDASSPTGVVRRTCAELSTWQNVDPERSARLFYHSHCVRKHFAVFLGDRISRKSRSS